ncbi:DUF4377 domain-containing protein [Pedobacter punctiformis]|uniref:DUF4377 domain-containing protein n=1 Tax=Pedobacter punctiformis TaxID=3004097 RepID=A0ABT4LCY4_9SPHI|nr:DUF4377 domain-containing protein [Pedobacter sp. HCMS5-2]MCZ4245772.1 DUF4377 domain-containing protein [Pedobacter sp. HCMS5-2]
MKSLLNLKSTYKLALSVIVLISISIGAKADTIRLTVKEEQADCTGVAPQTCFQVKYKNSKNWEFFYSQISGFDYKPGFRYVIDVTRTKRKNVPADASAYTYKLKKVITKTQIFTKKPDSWTFVTKHNWKLIQMNGVTLTNSTAYLTFQSDKNTMSGSGGCNRIFGGFELKDDQITFKNIASTMMACIDGDKSKLENEFLKLLSNHSFKYDVADQTLNFYQDNKLVFMFGMAPLDK